MRPDISEIAYQTLVFDENKTPVSVGEYSEQSVKLASDGSTWVFREFSDVNKLNQEALYWEWGRRFFSSLILKIQVKSGSYFF